MVGSKPTLPRSGLEKRWPSSGRVHRVWLQLTSSTKPDITSQSTKGTTGLEVRYKMLHKLKLENVPLSGNIFKVLYLPFPDPLVGFQHFQKGGCNCFPGFLMTFRKILKAKKLKQIIQKLNNSPTKIIFFSKSPEFSSFFREKLSFSSNKLSLKSGKPSEFLKKRVILLNKLRFFGKLMVCNLNNFSNLTI